MLITVLFTAALFINICQVKSDFILIYTDLTARFYKIYKPTCKHTCMCIIISTSIHLTQCMPHTHHTQYNTMHTTHTTYHTLYNTMHTTHTQHTIHCTTQCMPPTQHRLHCTTQCMPHTHHTLYNTMHSCWNAYMLCYA